MHRPWIVSYDTKRFYYTDHIIGTEYDEIIFILWFYTIVTRSNYLFKNNNLFTYTNEYIITNVLPNTFQFKGYI